jgi:hypothetical protein
MAATCALRKSPPPKKLTPRNLVQKKGRLYGPGAHFFFPNAHVFFAKTALSETGGETPPLGAIAF